MPKIIIYTTSICPYCMMAKRLLSTKGVAFNEIDVGGKPGLRAEMEEKSGRHTVPQIWIGPRHVGGCDDLHDLDARGELDRLLAA